ncbi:MAG TPA: IS66 family transposase [Solirubrobacteraceae bacterium]|nr:IS66 family transposase [Solirubrobacteraceae bacterium]
MQLRREEVGRVARDGGDAAEAQALLMFDLLAEHAERIEKLERRLGQNSGNSSLPPSSDRPDREQQAEQKPRPRKRSGKKRGGQRGHKGSGRELDPDPDETVEHRPSVCRKCGRELTGAERVVGRPARHQVIELPDTAVVTTEHRMLRVVCPGCGTHNRAELPAGVEQGAFGPKLRATIVTLAAMLMSRRTTMALLRDVFGARVSVGSIDNILKQAGELLSSPWEAIKRAAQAAEVLHADETSWRRAGQRIWLWAALSATACCFRIDETRARSAARALLGEFDGLLIADRYSVYDFIDPWRRQACLAHLARTFQAFAERDGPAGRHGEAIRGLIDEVIRADSSARRAGQRICWDEGELNQIHNRLMDAVEAGERCRTPELSRLCGTVLDIWPMLWNFTEHPDAEATNNRCERAVRHAVLWRKTSLGTQSEAGDRFVERILSIRETCQLNQRPLHNYLIDVHHARLTGQDIPTPLGVNQIAA